mmetsp:Transcript_6110/g.18524  ORF Transcript_6110/g.18524 Transcript_6110/m.18524 type:complete len:442 (+) Transcript_6110:1268-2593(+)
MFSVKSLSDDVSVQLVAKVADRGKRGLALHHLLHEVGKVLLGHLVEICEIFPNREPLAVKQHLPSDVLADDPLGLEVVQDLGHRGGLGPRELLVCEAPVGDGIQLAAQGVHQLRGVPSVKEGRAHPDQPSLVVNGAEVRAVRHPVVVVQDVGVEPGVHALARPAGGEGPATAEHGQQDLHHGGSLEVLVPALKLEGEDHVVHVVHGRQQDLPPGVLGGLPKKLGDLRWRLRHSRQELLGDGHDLSVLRSRDGEDHVAPGVVVLDVGPEQLGELLVLHVAEGLRWSDQGVAEAARKAGDVHGLLEHGLGVVLELRGVLEDGPPLLVDLPGVEDGVDDGVHQDLHHLRDGGADPVDGVDHLLPAGAAGDGRSEALNLPRDAECAPIRGGRERQLVQHMRQPAPLVHASALDVEPNAGGGGVGGLRGDLHAVAHRGDLRSEGIR